MRTGLRGVRLSLLGRAEEAATPDPQAKPAPGDTRADPHSNDAEPPASRPRLPRQLAAFRHRNYRLFFAGQLISVTGTWMQNVAHGWLVLQITPEETRALLMGVVSAVSTAPVLLFSLPAGLLADRVSKRNLLVLTQTSAMVLALSLGLLTHLEAINIVLVAMIGFLLGTVNAFDAPTRQSYVIEMVGREDLMNAIALNSAVFNGARIAGPAAAGVLIAAVGLAGVFTLNGLSYLAVIAGLLLMRVRPVKPSRIHGGLDGLQQGFRYLRHNGRVRALLTRTGVMSAFAMSYTVLMPLFVYDHLRGGARELGYLMSAIGVGALAGAVTLSSLSPKRSRGKLLLAGCSVAFVGLVAFSFSRDLTQSLCILPFVGWGLMTTMASTNTLIQLSVPDSIRGRVVSVYTLMFMGMAPLGSLQAGALAQVVGVPGAIRVGVAVAAASAALLSPFILRGADRIRVRAAKRLSARR